MTDFGGSSVVDDVAFPACLLDRDFRYRQADDGWADDLHGDRFRLSDRTDQARGSELPPGRPEQLRARWTAALRAIVNGRLGHFLDETTEQPATGERLVVTTASPWIGPDGAVDGVFCVRYDLTDARRGGQNDTALTEVLEAARRLQHFMGNQLAADPGLRRADDARHAAAADLRERVNEALRGVVEATDTLAKLRSVIRLELAPDDPSLAGRPRQRRSREDLD